MRLIRNLGMSLILVGLIGACLKQPEFSIIPQISIKSVTFLKAPTSTKPKDDTIKIVLDFSDGDGDLGLSTDETAIYVSGTDSIDVASPFYFLYDSTQPNTSQWYVIHQNNWTNSYLASIGYPALHYVDYASVRKYKSIQAFDTLPGLNCNAWEVRLASQSPVIPKDTLYYQSNPNYANIFVDIYTAPNANGPFTNFDPNNLLPGFNDQCQGITFNGRFPILSSDLGNKSPIQGTLTYNLESLGFYYNFQGQTIRVSVYIMDRALHKSNVVTSDPITIP